MSVFVDTSAFYAVLDSDCAEHKTAAEHWAKLIGGKTVLVSSNYVLVETIALVQHRLGMRAVCAFDENVLPMVHVEWVDERYHKAAMASLLTAARRQLSLVDCVSFEVMRRLGIKVAFTLDRHFDEQGFECLPG